MMQGPFVLICNTGDGGIPRPYVIPEVSPKELRYLQLLEGAHDEDLDKDDKDHLKRRNAYLYVSYMIREGYAGDQRYFARKGPALFRNCKQIIEAGHKWEECRVDTFAEVNSKYGDSIAGVFCINHTIV